MCVQEGDEDQFGEVRDEVSDNSEGEEADFGCTLSANVSYQIICFIEMKLIVYRKLGNVLNGEETQSI